MKNLITPMLKEKKAGFSKLIRVDILVPNQNFGLGLLLFIDYCAAEGIFSNFFITFALGKNI